MLTLHVLNSDAQLNTFLVQNSFVFTEGSDRLVVLRIHDLSKNLRYIPQTGATFQVVLLNSDATTVTKTPTNPFPDDRSIVSFSISAAESHNLISQNLILKVTEGAASQQILLRNGFSKIPLQSC